MAGLPLLGIGRTKNSKTGDVPTMWVGRTREESRQSCSGCPHLVQRSCYSQYGTCGIAMAQIEKSYAVNPAKYEPVRAIERRNVEARIVRVTALGDAARADRSELWRVVDAAKAAGLTVIGYTHFWHGDGRDLRGVLMASCDTWQGVTLAVALGWRATLVLPAGTTGTRWHGGVKAVECPAIRAARTGARVVTCNDCRLCDGSKRGPVVYFADHGPNRGRRLDVIA